MARCQKCNKKGLFLQVNNEGLCKDCQRIATLEIEEKNIKQSIEHLKAELSDKDKLYNSIAEKAKADALKNINEEIKHKQMELGEYEEKKKMAQNNLDELANEVEKSEKAIKANTKKLQKMQTIYKSIQYAVNNFLDYGDVDESLSTNMLNEEAEEILSATVQLKLHLMDVKQLRKLYNQNYKIIQDVLEKYKGRYTTKTNMTIYKLMVIALEAELQNVLYNINYGKLENAIKDIKAITAKYFKITTEGNQSIAPTVTKFIGEIEYLFIEAVKIEYEYYVQKERIKEEQRAIREQMRQEAEERKQLEQQRKQVEKEEEKYKNELSSIAEQLAATTDEQKLQQLQQRIEQLQEQLLAVEHKKEEIINLQNGKVGYVYVISNLGSFGDNVFKIGMTRRLEPQERVNELGDASVPFPFDVHSFIFSDDAVGLEQNIHKTLNSRRVNKVNLRKEFFNITIDEIEELVNSLEPSAEFNRTLLAEQYYQSLSINNIPDNIKMVQDDDDLDEDEE